MGKLAQVLIMSVCLLLGGCAIHPLPKDYSGYSTRDIAYRIRCETKDALRIELADLFSRSDFESVKQLGVAVAEHRIDISELTDDQVDFDAKTYALVNKFRASAINYTFRFQITENNKNGGGLSLGVPFTTPKFSMGVTAGRDKTRVSLRKFKVNETFEETAALNKCHNHDVIDENRAYPIVGSIGLAESINTFTGVVTDGNLAESFQDKLTFTTKLSGSVKPSISLSPFKGALSLTAANLDFVADRTDVHEVDISIAHIETAVPRRMAIRRKRMSPGGTPVPNAMRGTRSNKLLSIDPRIRQMVKEKSLYDANRNEAITLEREILDAVGR